ncbi:MAG: nanoRNase/pAp phosphatase (c-di-AMP/oligoRNAs hydrolase), partial [Cyclobacteriaceae bacterium]
MKSFQLKALSILGVLSMILSSCGGGGQESASGSESAEFDEAKTQVISNINQVIKDLPPPSEVPYLLMATGT